MVFRFRRRGVIAEAPRLRQRAESDTIRVEFTDFHPDTSAFLGQAAYLQLSVFEALSDVASRVADVRTASAVASAAGVALAKHEALIAEIRRREEDPGELMAEPRRVVAPFRESTAGGNLDEDVLAVYITSGFLDDLYVGLAASLPADVERHVGAVLAADNGRDVLRQHLQARIAEEPGLASVLAMWGRRLVGDTILVAHRALPLENGATQDRVEPVFTELIAAHTRRMDGLGLTA